MSAKHTPGPWFVRRSLAGGHGAYLHITSASRDGIAVTNKAGDAVLIAEAPDLLALLVESQESIGGDWRQRRDAAIAKATGEQP